MFRVPGTNGYGALAPVDADRLGLTEDSLLLEQPQAEGGREGEVEIVPVADLGKMGRSWTPWSLECLKAAAEEAALRPKRGRP